MVNIKDLLPTQTRINLDESLYFALSCRCSVNCYFTQPALDFLSPIVTVNNKYIVDGHHRWCQVYIVNPNATLKSVNFFNKNKNLSKWQLECMNGFFTIKSPNFEYHTSSFNNVFTMSEKEILDYIQQNISDNFVKDFLNYNKEICERNIVEYLLKNSMELKSKFNEVGFK